MERETPEEGEQEWEKDVVVEVEEVEVEEDMKRNMKPSEQKGLEGEQEEEEEEMAMEEDFPGGHLPRWTSGFRFLLRPHLRHVEVRWPHDFVR